MTENIKAITDFLFIENELEDLGKCDLLVVLCNNNIKGISEKIDTLYKMGILDESSSVVISGNRGSLDDFEGTECENL